MADNQRDSSAIRNEAVGSRLGRLFSRNRTQDEQDILDAYRRNIDVRDIRRARENAAPSPAMTAPPAPVAEAVVPAPAARVAAPEIEAVVQARRAERNRRLPNTRMSAPEMSADDLNALSMARGVGPDEAPDSAAAANIRRRLAEMGQGLKKGGKVKVKKMAKGGAVSSAASRADGCAARGKTKGRMV